MTHHLTNEILASVNDHGYFLLEEASTIHVPGRNKLEAWPKFMIEIAALLSNVKLKKYHEAHSLSSNASSLVRPRSGL